MIGSNTTLNREVDVINKPSAPSPSVNSAMQLYERARNIRDTDVEQSWRKIAQKYVDTFDTTGITEKKTSIKSKLIFQGHQRIITKMKRPDRVFVGEGASSIGLEVVRDGINSVQEAGGLQDAFMANWGAAHRFVLLGDAFILVTPNPDKNDTNKINSKTPVTYKSVPLQNVYVDPFALSMRNEGGVNDCKEVLVVFEMSYDEAKRQFPNAKFRSGCLPMDMNDRDRIDFTNEQESEMEDRKVQIGYYYNIQAEKPVQLIIAGTGADEISRLEGDKYPFYLKKDNNDPFIPLVNFKCFPVPTGFYGRGVGHILYDISIVQEKLRNLAIYQVEDNVNPIAILNILGDSKNFTSQLLQAREARALREKAVILNEIDGDGSPSNSGQIQQLITNPLTQEYERMLNDLIIEVKRCGFPIDDIDRPVSETATATIAEETRATAFVQQIQETNSDSYKDLDLFTMAIIRDTVDPDDETPITTHAKLSTGEMVNDSEHLQEMQRLAQKFGMPPARQRPVTIGDVSDFLQVHDVSVDVKSRSGALKSSVVERAEIESIFPLIQGTPIANKLISKRLRLAGLGFSEEELAALEQAPVQAGQPGQSEGTQVPTGAPEAGIGALEQALKAV